ncbi:ABC transporter ATP-binding protein [Rugosimonospora africana]|uniref:Daunorubicin resistance protein DrrA family ABC transporter ATP-binding protein n=1 Tax=Rugosimonospora africana TaxID=556532 RepID=A0A8J3QVR6_9ACTN|nr:ATP-binding cassette domain-containing protein [Rugosimonospora africana]GIH16715.1 daunorubicin resistance protein DrrA family ABC transporter ATP-binding protein [Rugosimonospora africana]
MSTPAPAVEAVELEKTYGKGAKAVRALDCLTFTVRPGIVFGLLGPNGAGKSTAVRILTTLSRPDRGRASILGIDVGKHPDQVRRLIGYVSQKPGFDPVATGMENLVLQGRVHGASARAARARAAELLDRLDLSAAARRLAGAWSGGMQRKLDVAMGLMHRPRVLFLDEPTTGLDPQARLDLWAEIARLARHDGLTVLLTTHYLDEADHLAAQLVIVDAGRVVAAGTPDQLKSELGGDTVRVGLVRPSEADRAGRAIGTVPGVSATLAEGATLQARVGNGAAALPAVLAALEGAGVGLTSVSVARPSLDDVYLHHAGRSFGEADRAGAGREVVPV